MDFSLEVIKDDLKKLPEKEFLLKYLLKSDNWYFSEYQNRPYNESVKTMEVLKEILNVHFGVAFHNVLMVGSGKTWCSLAPTKKLKKFDDGEDDSDIDIAIISSKLFNELWAQVRFECRQKYIGIYQYNQIASSVFRGFINEHHFMNFDAVRPHWNKIIDNANKDISKKISIYHSINYRVYRSWEDLEAYHLSGIKN